MGYDPDYFVVRCGLKKLLADIDPILVSEG